MSLHTTKSEAIKDMVWGLNQYAENKGIDLTDKIPDDVNNFDEVFNDGGEGRCEHFVDLAYEYAYQFGTIDDYKDHNGFESHVWKCINSAMAKLQKQWNKVP